MKKGTFLRNLVGNVAALALGLSIAALVAEGAARVLGVGAPAELDPSFDRESHYLMPERTRAHLYGGGDEEPLKVAIIGDSFTVGQANQWYDAFPARLERLLNLNDGVRPVRVTAYARKGMSTADQRRFLYPAIEEGTDLMILAIFLNDTEDVTDPELDEWKRRMYVRPLEGWKLTLAKRSRAVSWLYQRWEMARCHRAQIEFTAHCFDKAYRGWGRFSDAVARFGKVTRQAEVPLVAVVFPPMAHLDPERYPYDYAHDQIEEELTLREIPFLDLRPTFVGRDTRRMAAYPGIDAHPSEIGHRLAAHEIFRYLLREQYLPLDYVPRRSTLERRSDWLLQVRRMRSIAFVDEVERSEVKADDPKPKKWRKALRARRRAAAQNGAAPAAEATPAPAQEPDQQPSGGTQ